MHGVVKDGLAAQQIQGFSQSLHVHLLRLVLGRVRRRLDAGCLDLAVLAPERFCLAALGRLAGRFVPARMATLRRSAGGPPLRDTTSLARARR